MTLENFKAFGTRQIVPFAPITLIYGRNSAGKSSILQALSLLKQTDEQRDLGGPVFVTQGGRYADLGGFQDVVYAHDLSRQVHLGVLAQATVESRDPPLGLEFAFGRRSASEDVSMSQLVVYKNQTEPRFATFVPIARQAEAVSSGVRPFQCADVFWDGTEHRSLGEFVLPKPGEEKVNAGLLLSYLIALDPALPPELRERWGRIQFDLRGLVDVSKGRGVLSPDAVRKLVSRVSLDVRGLAPVGSRTSGGLPGLGVLHRLAREWPALMMDVAERPEALSPAVAGLVVRNVLAFLDAHDATAGGPLFDVGQAAIAAGQAVAKELRRLVPIGPLRHPPARYYAFSGNTPTTVGAAGQQMPELLFRRPPLVFEVNRWLRRLDVGYELKVRSVGGMSAELFELRLFDQANTGWVEVGVSDVGFGVSQILPVVVQSLANTKQVLAIEQPEVHVHPRLQAELGDLFIESAREHGNQFLLETHSEHLALRIQKRVREGTVNPDEVCVLYVERGANGSTVTRIPLDQDGDFTDDFPGGFFTERLRELRRE